MWCERTARRRAGALALVLSLCAASLRAAEDPVRLKVVVGFEGIVCYHDFFPLTVEIANRGAEAIRGDLVIDRGSRGTSPILRGIDVGPGTTVRRRVVLEGDTPSPLGITFRGPEGPIVGAADVLRGIEIEFVAILAVDDGKRRLRLDPRWLGSTKSVVPCRPAYLPADTVAYDGVGAIVIGEADPARWETGQVEAAEEYLRRGGVVILNGGKTGRLLLSSPIVRRWLAGRGRSDGAGEGAETPRARPPERVIPEALPEGEALFRADVPGARVLLAAGEEPILQAVRYGLGAVIACGIDLFASQVRTGPPAGDEALLEAVAAAIRSPTISPFSDALLTCDPKMSVERIALLQSSGDRTGVTLVAAYLVLYALLIAVAVAGIVQARRGLRRPLALAAVIVAFCAGVPLLFAALARYPSRSIAIRYACYRSDGGGGELLTAFIGSAGAGGHRLRLEGRNLVAYPISPVTLGGHPPFVDARLPLRHPDELTVDLPMRPWEGAGIVALGDATSPPPFAMRAWRVGKKVRVRIERNRGLGGRILTRGEAEATRRSIRRSAVGRAMLEASQGFTFEPILIVLAPDGRAGGASAGGEDASDQVGLVVDVALLKREGEAIWEIDLEKHTLTLLEAEGAPATSAAPTGGWVLLGFAVSGGEAIRMEGDGIQRGGELRRVQQIVPIEAP